MAENQDNQPVLKKSKMDADGDRVREQNGEKFKFSTDLSLEKIEMRNYKRKTDRGKTPIDVLKRAAKEVKDGKSVRSVSKDFNIDRMTLKRFIVKKTDDSEAVTGYKAISLKHSVIPPDMEKDLANHVKHMADMFHGLSLNKCCVLAYEFASQNQIDVPISWIRNGKAGKDWWLGFRSRYHLSIRSPEATSFARAAAFNEPVVNKFYDNLKIVLDKYQFQPSQIFNCDETGCTTVQKPKCIISERGRKQVGAITSAERGELETVVYTVSAVGNVLPPMFILPRVNYRDHFINGSPSGSIGRATKTGWINENLFLDYLRHIIHQTRCSQDQKIRLIMDNHESHISLNCIDLARANGIVLLTIPPHTSHRLQPLDRSVYGPFKGAFNRAMDGWLRSNPGKTVTIYDLPQIVNEAHLVAMTPRNIIAGFKSTGIYPFNRDLFSHVDFAPASVTDRAIKDTEMDSMIHAENSEVQTGADKTNLPSTSNTERSTKSSTSSVESEDYVSPSDILPVPKTTLVRKQNVKRKKGSTKILTDTPTRNSIAACVANKGDKINSNAKKSLFKRQTVEDLQTEKDEISSSSESEIEFEDSSDDDVFEDDEIIEGDFVVVQVSGKSRKMNYIARVDLLDGEEYEGVFLQKVTSKIDSTGITFVPNEDDLACFPKGDILFKLPKPSIVGGSVRRACQLQFKCDLSKYNLIY